MCVCVWQQKQLWFCKMESDEQIKRLFFFGFFFIEEQSESYEEIKKEWIFLWFNMQISKKNEEWIE